MATCPNCGSTVDGGAAACPACGAPMGGTDAATHKGLLVCAYLFWIIGSAIALVAMRNRPRSAFTQTHLNSALVLALANVAVGVLAGVLGKDSPVAGALSIAVLVLAIIGIVNVAKGQARPLPLIGSLRLVK